MYSIISRGQRFARRRIFKYGLPFLVLVVGGSFGLREFTQLRYQFGRQQSTVLPQQLERLGIEVKKPGEVTLESEYEKIKKLDIDNWESKRVFRPWEAKEKEEEKRREN